MSMKIYEYMCVSRILGKIAPSFDREQFKNNIKLELKNLGTAGCNNKIRRSCKKIACIVD